MEILASHESAGGHKSRQTGLGCRCPRRPNNRRREYGCQFGGVSVVLTGFFGIMNYVCARRLAEPPVKPSVTREKVEVHHHGHARKPMNQAGRKNAGAAVCVKHGS